MSYNVIWTQDAEEELAAAWVSAADQRAVTIAANEIENQLKFTPLASGESRTSPLRRVLLCPPLGVWFDIIEDDKKVRILAVWLIL